jgi:hypothetical protein
LQAIVATNQFSITWVGLQILVVHYVEPSGGDGQARKQQHFTAETT